MKKFKKKKLKEIRKNINPTKPVTISKRPKLSASLENNRMSDKESQSKKRDRVFFSMAEDKFIADLCMKMNVDKISHIELQEVAKKCNIEFHDRVKIRDGVNLWWHIKRAKKSGKVAAFADIPLSGGTPKVTAGTRLGKIAKVMTPDAVQTALRSSSKPKMPPKAQPTPKNGHKPTDQPHVVSVMPVIQNASALEIVIRDTTTGLIKKIITEKFKSIEEAIFALA